ncbi:MAG TPA: carboxylate-amine ligase [Rhodomicrobium sp.]|nr:carboxylate-amine ligase [Rhodomicrobium sp.]
MTNFQFGIEEEYFLADAVTMRVARETPESLFREVAAATNGQAGRELLQAQIEVSTAPQKTAGAMRDHLASLRAAAGAAAARHGLTILASGTHPSAEWPDISQSPSKRYDGVMTALRMVGCRNMLCGMHVHVEVPDPSRRVELMGRLTPYLPLLLALSTSSPFWQGRNTGLKGYRLAAYDEIPRTGIPEFFASKDDYQAYVTALIGCGAIEDESHIWWMLRPSLKYPTIELRAPDCCTRIEDAIAIACLFRVVTRHLFCQSAPSPASPLQRALAVENKWRAQRDGIQATLATQAGPVSAGDMLRALIKTTAEDAAALECENEIAHCSTIMDRGASAEEQLKVYEQEQNAHDPERVTAVAQWIAKATMAL